MLERYLSHILTTKFGHVVENLDENKVRVSAWNGEVVLEDLHLRQNALDALLTDTPFEIRYGRIGKLELRIPWKVLRSAMKEVKCSVVLSDVCILIAPKRARPAEDDNSVQQSLAENRAAKEEQVQALMDANLFKRSMDGKANATHRWHWVREWVTSLLSNLSVTVLNVHIRYEDPGKSFGLVWNDSKTSSAFSVGMTLRQFSVQTTERGPLEEDESYSASDTYTVTHKLAAAYQLSIYWDRGCPLMITHVDNVVDDKGFSSVVERDYYASSFQFLNDDSSETGFVHARLFKGTDHNYFLNPISPSLRLALVRESEPEKNSKGSTSQIEQIALPPSSAVLTMPQTQLLLSKNILEESAYLRKCFAMWNQVRRNQLPGKVVRVLTSIRPTTSAALDPRSWWKYACNATLIILKSSAGETLIHRKQKSGWLNLARALGSRTRYAKLYLQLITSSNEPEKKQIHQQLVKMEDNLEAEAIVNFRIFSHGYWRETDGHDKHERPFSIVGKQEKKPICDSEVLDDLYPLSVEHRLRMYKEMSRLLDNERYCDVLSTETNLMVRSSVKNESAIIWKTLLVCPEISLQVNQEDASARQSKKRRRKVPSENGIPIARLACSPLYRHTLFEDGSWDSTASIASLELLDLTSRAGSEITLFPVLIGRKAYSRQEDFYEELVLIHGVEHRLCISVTVARKLSCGDGTCNEEDIGSTTITTIRLLPLEVVYSTKPIAALSNIFLTVKTPELADDFHRMASLVSKWQESQRKRLLLALAHKKKKIVVDVDVSAPVLFVPEDVQESDSPMLVIDLGRLQFCNAEKEESFSPGTYDDVWKLGLSRIQVLTTTTASYRAAKEERRLPHQIIEPFSLDFTISTSISAEAMIGNDDEGKDLLHVSATLPRLVFNLNTSAVRLLLRLQRQWRHQTFQHVVNERPAFADINIEPTSSVPIVERSSKVKKNDLSTGQMRDRASLQRAKAIHFDFSAPLIALKLVNDVDGRDCRGSFTNCALLETDHSLTTLGHLIIRGIRGSYQQELSSLGAIVGSFEAKMRSLEAFDLYQQAGSDFSMFLSSALPDIYENEIFSLDKILEGEGTYPELCTSETDLVSIRYFSRKRAPGTKYIANDDSGRDVVAILFHELFVEWNPETVAAIHKAMQLPSTVCNIAENLNLDDSSRSGEGLEADTPEDDNETSDDEFFDALDGHDDGSLSSPVYDRDFGELSEISSGSVDAEEVHFSVAHSALSMGINPYPATPIWCRLSPAEPLRSFYSPGTSGVLSPAIGLAVSDKAKVETDTQGSQGEDEWRPFEITFDLSKLRVNFNKESRRRRLLVAEMDGTTVRFITRAEGGSKTTARIGNLALSDPSAKTNSTLYNEIVGLQSDFFTRLDRKQSSLLELTFISNPKTRNIVSMPLLDSADMADINNDSEISFVTVDTNRGTISGCDYFVSLQFSPMRFVYLQQLWFEVIDYFFEGIIGTEVWGNTRPPPLSIEEDLELSQNGPSTAFSIKMTRPVADAKGMRFTKFIIEVESPIVLVPVTYRSPQFLRLEFDSLKVANFYRSSAQKTRTDTPHLFLQERVQWFNNCTVTLKDLRLKSWCGTELSRVEVATGPTVTESSKNAEITLSWPTGPGAQLVRPKWNVNCRVDDVNIYLRKTDFALLQNIIMHNIGEPSRHLDEWIELQALPKSQLERYKNQIMVHFGYDKKDAIPTTYKVEVKVSSLGFFLAEGSTSFSGETIAAEARCVNLVWGMQKLSDCISRQHVTCDIVISQPCIVDGITSTVHLILPSELDLASQYSTPAKACDGKRAPELIYTSTSRTSGDNVKTLDISNACIHCVYPAWIRVGSFFSGLQAPEVWTENEVSLSMQIGDRWYQIGGTTSTLPPSKLLDDEVIQALQRSSSSRLDEHVPSYEFHLRLVAPRVVLNSNGDSSEMATVVLHMDHFDYLQINGNAGVTTRSFFVHNLELYTSARATMKRDLLSRNYSLIRPWSTIGVYERCNGRNMHCCQQHRMIINAEVLRARAAYSDMSIAVDVGLRLFADFKSTDLRHQSKGSSRNDIASKAATEDKYLCCAPLTDSIVVGLEGLHVLVIDDSCRHFADAQELIELSLNSIHLLRERKIDSDALLTFSTRIQLTSINLLDRLQPVESRFRLVATSQELGQEAKSVLGNAHSRLKWTEYSSRRGETWGVAVSEALINDLNALSLKLVGTMASNRSPENSCAVDLQSLATEGKSRHFNGRLTSLTLQWNPSTVIALQRFLGRLVKESNQKSVGAYHECLDDLLASPTAAVQKVVENGVEDPDAVVPATPAVPIEASLRLDKLTLCFNKEHQNRRLLKATFSNSSVELFLDADRGLYLQGGVKDVSAWDADDYELRDINIVDSNRRILRVVDASTSEGDEQIDPMRRPHFFQFEFKTYPTKAKSSAIAFPGWIQSLLASMNDESQEVDDYLSISIAALEFAYLRERTEELLDYLSNGLPGKGMGATSRAATGFIKKRIQTRSFLKLAIDSPQLKIPQGEGTEEGILLRLGDFCLKSWFHEESVAVMSDFSSNARSTVTEENDKDWWRMLTLSILGLGWETYGGEHKMPTATKQLPVDLLLELRKPTSVERTVLFQASLSYVDLRLAYSDYALCRSVLRENIARKIDMDRWDNVEKAYWMEQQASSESLMIEQITPLESVLNHRVAYSSNARFVRYGQKTKVTLSVEEPKGSIIASDDVQLDKLAIVSIPDRKSWHFKFDLGGLRLTLHRDDPPKGLSDLKSMSAFNYDVVLLTVENIETTMTSNKSGDISFHLSLYRTGVFDLGDLGRLARNQYYQTFQASASPKKVRSPSAFCVLAEGYSQSDQPRNTDGDAQLVVTVDTCPASSIGSVGSSQVIDLGSEKVTIARIVINHLSVNVLVRPLREIVSFLTCAWPLSVKNSPSGLVESKWDAVSTPSVGLKNNTDTKSSGFQLKLVTHYPRVFFVADESDPHSRALVLRGLAVINVSYLTQRSTLPSYEDVLGQICKPSELQTTTALDAHLHSLESYINPDVSWTLGLQQQHAQMMGRSLEQMLYIYSSGDEPRSSASECSLGVALIEPVTTSIELCQVSKDRFPTLRSMTINMEPVSTMLSFEDLSLIRGIIERLSYNRGNKIKAELESDLSKPEQLLDSQNPTSRLQEGLTEQIVVVFQNSRLGLVLRSAPSGIVVEGVHNVNLSPRVKEGDLLLSIDGSPVQSMDLHTVVETLAQTPRPTTLVFERYDVDVQSNDKSALIVENPSKSTGDRHEINRLQLSKSCYTIRFACGCSNGLSIERSAICNAPVVTGIDMDEFVGSVIPTSGDNNSFGEQTNIRAPLKGAVIVCVEGLNSPEIGYTKTAGIINGFCSDNTTHQSSGGLDDQSSGGLNGQPTYTLAFIELESETWGTVDCVDIAVTGISLTFIDDVKGRDMPLFRGRLAGIEIRLERGIGIETSLIEAKAPIFLCPISNASLPLHNVTAVNNADGRTWGHLAKPIIKSFAILQGEVEYYHPKIAVWEPFIEPSQFCSAVEWQPGFMAESKPRCGQLAVRLSDRLAPSDPSAPGRGGVQDIVTINLTDSAIDVIMSTVREWKEWTKPFVCSVKIPHETAPPRFMLTFDSVNATPYDEDADVKSNEDKTLAKHNHKIAPQKAAQAALLFAQKRGAATNKQGESSKPFLLRNRTGLEIQFSYEKPEMVANGLITDQDDNVLADGQDARFSMEMLTNSKSDQVMDSFRRGVKKVRTYEGRFPRLSVSFHAPDGVTLAPLHDLPASKVGMSLRNTKCDTFNNRVSTVPVLWSVEVEDNRRILTISSAVQINSTGLETSIEVGYASSSLSQSPEESTIISIGSAMPGLPFFIPLWLTLRFEGVGIFVRPIVKGESMNKYYSWSNFEILKYSVLHPLDFVSIKEEFEITVDDMVRSVREERWGWRETFDTSCSALCKPDNNDPSATNQTAAWLSCRIEPRDPEHYGLAVKKNASLRQRNTQRALQRKEDMLQDVITIAIEFSMTLRNMLPSNLEWQIAVKLEGRISIVAGSGLDADWSPLAGGECVEIAACDVMDLDVHARFRCKHEHEWTPWEAIALDLSTSAPASNPRMERRMDNGNDRTSTAIIVDYMHDLAPRPRQVNVQSIDDFGGHLTLGLRMIPKLVKAVHFGVVSLRCFGIDVIVYAELWLRNKTNLPLSFGCPNFQIQPSLKASTTDCTYQDNGKMVAEAALLEIASVLEFGDKGKNLENQEEAFSSIVCPLPFQESNIMYYEVFEFVEMDRSIAKHRWWACENPASLKLDPSKLDQLLAVGWRWLDDKWQIDCSGQTSHLGWESCRSLFGSKDFGFNGNRIFTASHPYRRRRWFRRMAVDGLNGKNSKKMLYGEVNAFHQPVFDSYSKAQLRSERRESAHQKNGQSEPAWRGEGEYGRIDAVQMSIKIGDGEWSSSANIPPTGTAHGVFRVPASRWPIITRTSWATAKELRDPNEFSAGDRTSAEEQAYSLGKANLSPEVFEFCYQVQDLCGDWGDFSRLLDVTPRFLLQNESEVLTIEIKQSGAPRDASILVLPGSVLPFHWADFRLPELLSVRPYSEQDDYRWSGGFDINRLGMIPIRVRSSRGSIQSEGGKNTTKSVRALVEIRSGSGGSGMKVSFREEDPKGDGALFRIENHSPFPIWLAQDGVLANPSTKVAPRVVVPISVLGSDGTSLQSSSWSDDRAEIDGDLIRPHSHTAYGLDIPFRQGKYAHRNVATLEELLRVRIGLAPLSSRDGIETTKVVGLTRVGDKVRLNITKIGNIAASGIARKISNVRILGIVATDGPTRVLKFLLMEKEESSDILNAFSEGMGYSAKPQVEQKAPLDVPGTIGQDQFWRQVTARAAIETLEYKAKEGILSEEQAKRRAFFGDGKRIQNPKASQETTDVIFSVQSSFSGFLFSLVDAAPSEIAVISLKGLNIAAKWDGKQKADASVLISVDWLQVDNHMPGAPFPVAICPDDREKDDSNEPIEATPLLLVGLTFAPKHKTGILCLKNMTVAPRNLAVAVDLAFIVRLQRYLIGIQEHINGSKFGESDMSAGVKKAIPLPEISTLEEWKLHVNSGAGRPKLYFEGLTILSASINLSIAPARALTTFQAELEGQEAAAIHAAVRKGDIGLASGLVGVHVGRTNKTAMAVVRGVFKSILVDALLRLDGASLNLSGVVLRNHISTTPQLMTLLGAHYVASMRSNLPALLGSLAAFGNPLGLIRGLGDGVSDFVNEPVKGLKKSMQELDPFLFVDGVARGTESLARHTVGGIAETASLLTETFSKNMAVLTLDRRYAQRRDRIRSDIRDGEITFVEGVESGVVHLVRGVVEGVAGVVKAPMRGAERSGMEGFAKGIGKGLLGLLVKPMIGLSDAATDFMIGVKGSVEGGQVQRGGVRNTRQIRPRRPMYGKDKVLRSYSLGDAAAATLMLRTRLAGDNYLSHLDMGDRVALMSVKEILLLGQEGQEALFVKFKNVKSIEVRPFLQPDGSDGWGIVIMLATPRKNGSEVEVVNCGNRRDLADELCSQMNQGLVIASGDT